MEKYFFQQKPVITFEMIGLCCEAEKIKDGAVLTFQCGPNRTVQVIMLDHLFEVNNFVEFLEYNGPVELKVTGIVEKDLPIMTGLYTKNTEQATRYYA